MLVELGGGTRPHPRSSVVVDPAHPRGSEARYAQQVPWEQIDSSGVIWTIEDESVDEVYASHVMEHVPKGEAVIKVLNEAWRVLRRGGSFTMLMPIIGYSGAIRDQPIWLSNWRPWADPTHISHWWLPESFYYFTGQEGADADYGVELWAPIAKRWPEEKITEHLATAELMPTRTLGESVWGVRGGWEGFVRLEKP